MRIIHVLDHSLPLHSGYVFRTQAILRQQNAFGWRTWHITGPRHQPGPPGPETVDGVEFHRTPAPAGALARFVGFRERLEMRGLGERLDRLAGQVGPDLLHAHSPVLNALPALRIARRRRVPLVYEVRALWEDAAASHGTGREGGARYRAVRLLETRALRQADAVVVICQGLKNELLARGLPEEKIAVVPNAVDLAELAAEGPPDPALRRRLGLGDGPVLGFFGSFYGYEGLHLLITALPALVADNPGLRLLLVGGGPEEQALKDLARRLGLAERVVFTGRVPHAEIGRHYDLADICIYPRLKMRLTDLVTPLKPLEAMARGRIVLAADVGGHRELVREGETGLLFPAGDAGALAEAIRGCLAARRFWPAIQARARRFVENERSWRACAARYRDVYAGLPRVCA